MDCEECNSDLSTAHVFAYRFLDVPCGDFQWMGYFLSSRNDVEYTGVDVVPELIENHKKKFANRTDWRFIHTDILVNPLQESFDLILCRMLLQHLVSADIFKMLNRFSASNSSFFLATTFSETGTNKDLLETNFDHGRFRPVNLEIPPYSLVSPVCMTRDGPMTQGNNHYVGLWKLPLKRIKDCSKASRMTYMWYLTLRFKLYGCARE